MCVRSQKEVLELIEQDCQLFRLILDLTENNTNAHANANADGLLTKMYVNIWLLHEISCTRLYSFQSMSSSVLLDKSVVTAPWSPNVKANFWVKKTARKAFTISD